MSLTRVLALALGLHGCTFVGDELYPPRDGIPPFAIATDPTDGAADVPLSVRPRVWFSEPVEPTSVGQSNFWLGSGGYDHVCRFRVEALPDGTGLVELQPIDTLLPGVRYRLVVDTSVTDLAGNPLAAPLEVAFQTLAP